MKKHLKSFKNFSVNEKVGVISGIHGFGEPEEKPDTEETKRLRAKIIADMRREVGANLVGYEPGEEDEFEDITSVETEENLPTIDIDKILTDYSKSLNADGKKEFANKLSKYIDFLTDDTGVTQWDYK